MVPTLVENSKFFCVLVRIVENTDIFKIFPYAILRLFTQFLRHMDFSDLGTHWSQGVRITEVPLYA